MKHPEHLDAAEIGWVHPFEQIPAWLARVFNDKIQEVNMENEKLWNKYMESYPNACTRSLML